MHDTGKILFGLVIFLGLVTSPLWFNMVSSEPATLPELTLPADEQQCVEATEYMRASHMDLLNEWRDAVVREGRRQHTSKLNGRSYEMSLSKTCLSCHSQKTEFCERCHNYLAVTPYCWDCHVEPKEGV